MTNKTMNIIPINCGGDEFNKKYDQYKGNTDNCGFWYLHGELENKCGYDKAIITNCKELGLYRDTIIDKDKVEQKMYANGAYECKVEGIDEPCVGYFYTTNEHDKTWIQRGLVCLKSDKDACQYAQKAMKERKYFL